ncbi:adenosine deaminase [Glaciibacter sp. 2TAF33]|uniref:adenosine deaminase n=1 Tax=Glaciibacter sp. 2TAF33 TaxID=3233015 RepID=UPI003F8E2033
MTDSTAETLASLREQPLPFCELHVHVEGTLQPAAIFDLAERNQLTLPYRDVNDLARRYEFTDLQSFLDLYYDNLSVLIEERDYYDLALRYLTRAHAAGVRHVELFVDPQAHNMRGVPTGSVLGGVSKAITQATELYGLTAEIIVCVLRDQPVAAAHRMLESVLASGIPLTGIGLDSAEIGNPPALFKKVFEEAHSHGLRRVAHAGEEGPAEYIWQALDDLGAERIDHGIRCLEDDALVTRLAVDRIPLTVCPLSNVRLGVVNELGELPLRQMLERNLVVTINSDDPAYFGGYLDENLEACIAAFGLNYTDLKSLAMNSIQASFASDARRAELMSELST